MRACRTSKFVGVVEPTWLSVLQQNAQASLKRAIPSGCRIIPSNFVQRTAVFVCVMSLRMQSQVNILELLQLDGIMMKCSSACTSDKFIRITQLPFKVFRGVSVCENTMFWHVVLHFC